MEFFVIIFSLFLSLGILALPFIMIFLLLNEGKDIKIETKREAPPPAPPFATYQKRRSVMNRSEQAFFYELKRQLPEGYFIFPKMRIADFIEPCNGRGFYYRRNQILPKHIDFLICNQNFEPIVALEVNGFSHRRFDRMLRDDAVRRIFKDAGMHLEFIEVGTNFEARIAEIFSTFKHPSQTPTTHLIP